MNYKRSIPAKPFIFILAAFLWVCMPLTLSQNREPSAPAPVRQMDPQDDHNLSLAYGYHELAVLYLEKGEVDKAATETRKLLKLRFSEEYEPLLVQSLGIITEKLARIRRFDLAQALLDEAVKSFERNSTQVKIYKTKARLYRLAGDNDKAIEYMNRALHLESR